MLFCERLPVKIERSGLTRFARSFATSMLMNDDPPKRLHGRWDPDRVTHRIRQFFRLGRRLIANSIIRWFRRQRDLIGWLLSPQQRCLKSAEQCDKRQKKKNSHGRNSIKNVLDKPRTFARPNVSLHPASPNCMGVDRRSQSAVSSTFHRDETSMGSNTLEHPSVI